MRPRLWLASALVVLTLPGLCRTATAREITEGSELSEEPHLRAPGSRVVAPRSRPRTGASSW